MRFYRYAIVSWVDNLTIECPIKEQLERLVEQVASINSTIRTTYRTIKSPFAIPSVQFDKETGPNLFQMMENAGRNLAQVAIDMLGRAWQAARITVLAGPGGNGGGGICAARHLANRRGRVALVLSDPDHLGDVPAMQRKIFHQTQGREIDISRIAEQRPDLIVDALIGYSLKAAPRGAAADLIRWANGIGAPILALDVPSGVDSTTGETAGIAITPQRTMTLALPKTGLFRAATGDLFLADIGIPEGAYRRVAATYIPPFEDRFWVSLTRR